MAQTHLLQHGFQAGPETSGTWRVWAPQASNLELVLIGASGQTSVSMRREEHGWFAYESQQIDPDQQYCFRLPSGLTRPDPASRWQPNGVHGPSVVFRPQAYRWTDTNWRGLPRAELVIYELHVGTFTTAGTLAAASERLAELHDLGITCIEIMPVAQFPGARGWGYDGVYPFAVQNSYGGPAALQAFVDACHLRGLAVLLDVVYNHVGPEGSYLGEFAPYFTKKYGTAWGPAFNYDEADSDGVRQYVLDNVTYWLRHFHFDGLRLDAVQTIFDMSPRHILREIGDVAAAEAEAAGREIHIIAESNLNDVRLMRAPEQGGYGLAAQWSDDLHHAVHTMLTGERQGYYADYGRPEQLAKALEQTFVYDGCYSAYHRRRYGSPAEDMSGDHFVVSMQTHDQVGNRALGERLSALLSPAALRLAAGVLLLAPHIPLLFMGEEYGETNPFPFFCSFGDKHLQSAVREGRRREYAGWGWPEKMPDPNAEATFRSAVLDWSWPPESWQAGLRRWYRDLLTARRNLPGLRDFVHRRAAWHRPPGDVSAEGPELQTATAPNLSRAGILELGRGEPLKESEIVAYFSFHTEPFPLREVRRPLGAADEPLPLYSSEWPQYGGQRSVDATDLQAAYNIILPLEVLVFGRREGPVPWIPQ